MKQSRCGQSAVVLHCAPDAPPALLVPPVSPPSRAPILPVPTPPSLLHAMTKSAAPTRLKESCFMVRTPSREFPFLSFAVPVEPHRSAESSSIGISLREPEYLSD